MTEFAQALHEDIDETKTSAVYGDAGDGTSRWYHWFRIADGGNPALGATTSAAITDPATDGTLISFIRGILTFLRVSAVGLGKAEDAVHASGDTGVMSLAVRRDTAAASSGTTGDYEPLQTDSIGRLRVTASTTVSVTHMAALAVSQVVKASAGTLHSIVGYIASGEDGWIQVHDAAAIPSAGAVPELSFFVGALSAHTAVNIPLPRHICTAGISLTWSTTGPTYTVGGAKMMVAGYYE